MKYEISIDYLVNTSTKNRSGAILAMSIVLKKLFLFLSNISPKLLVVITMI